MIGLVTGRRNTVMSDKLEELQNPELIKEMAALTVTKAPPFNGGLKEPLLPLAELLNKIHNQFSKYLITTKDILTVLSVWVYHCRV